MLSSEWTLKGNRLPHVFFVVVIEAFWKKSIVEGLHPPLSGMAFIRYFFISWGTGLDVTLKKSSPFAVLGFELRALCLLGRLCTA
jgi:hypothetical protein